MSGKDRLGRLESGAAQPRERKDAAAAGALLQELAGIGDAEVASYDLEDLKRTMQVAALLADFADARLFALIFTRSINAMQALSEPPPAVDYIAPVYNLREKKGPGSISSKWNDLPSGVRPWFVVVLLSWASSLSQFASPAG